ncbi:MAG: hypothetical protein R3F02_09270 [Thiolinea sp.]
MLLNTKSAPALVLAGFLFLFAVSAEAEEQFRVNLIATIDNGPAMEKVEWTVYRNGTEAFKKARKHLTQITVPPGKYTAEARLTDSDNRTIVRKRNFYVSNNTEVVVPMD